MAIIKAFKALRPKAEYASQVAALPYDVMNSEEAREMVKGKPYSFLHVDKAEIDLDSSISPYDNKVYEKASDNLYGLLNQGILMEEGKPCFYVYRQIMEGRAQTGLVVCTAIDDYLNNVIKKHEFTRADKEQDRINHVDYCNANTGPIFLTYRKNHRISEILANAVERSPLYDFVAEDGVGHVVWIIQEEKVVEELIGLFASVDYLYIADGHHRAASAVKVGLKRREENPGFDGNEEYNFFLSVVFPDQELHIMDYNRVVMDLNGNTEEDFMAKVQESFIIEEHAGVEPYRPEIRHTYGMYLEGKWYKLTAREGTFVEEDPVERLDVSILQRNLLDPILGIKYPRTDKRIDFIGGIRGLKELERRVQEGMKVAFAMYPTTIQELMDIADSGQVMPPKSTWFEPKLRSGLFIHRLS